MKGGRSTNAIVESVDVFPTLAQLCGLESPADLQGRSFVPLLKKPDLPWKQAALWQYPREGNWRSSADYKIMGYSMLTKRYHYVEWVDLSTHQVKARELYDLRNDPEENANVIGDTKKYGSVINRLSVLLHTRWKESLTPGGFSSLVPAPLNK
jgi:iduronate 2-sulfatase